MKNRSIFFLLLVVAALAFTWLRPLHHDQQPAEPGNEGMPAEEDNAAAVPSMPLIPSSTVAGNYLAARFAVASDDLEQANTLYNRAVNATSAPDVKGILYERSLPAAIGAGDMEDALKIAHEMDVKQPTATAQLAVLLELSEAFKQKDNAKINEFLPLLRSDGFGRLLKPLLEAWNFVGQDNYPEAFTTLAKLQKEYPSLKPLVQMHLAFIHDFKNEKAPAEIYYSRSLQDHLSIRMAYIAGQFYEHIGKEANAKQLYQNLAQQMPSVPWPQIAVARIEKGDLKQQAFITSVSDGVAAALYDVATVLHEENSSRLAILYAQMAHYLMPQDEFAALLLGDIASSSQISGQAEKYFQSIPETSDLYVLSRLRLAQFYQQQEDYAKAIPVLEKFENDTLVSRQAMMELGDLYRRKEDFAKAIPYYSKVLEGMQKFSTNDWVLFYSRGMCFERNGEWDKAEADLTQALKLSPQQPEVLNYLAYSWADHGKNLPRALEMLQKALAGAPDDPYITDSLGWALHKNGQNNEAVNFLEVSVQQLPEDPVINDHLGDIYWSVGRKLEAQFQWERALKNAKETDKELKDKLQAKLQHGLQDDPKIVHAKTAAALSAANE